jgi:hypothetical protein
MPEDETPQVAPSLLKSVVREAIFGASIYAVVGFMSHVFTLSKKLEVLALRVAEIETIYQAEAVTVDAHRNWPETPGTDIPGASE